MIPVGALGLLLAALALPTLAADAAKEVTITGEAKCAKCALHETKECQTVIQSEENGKTVTYYLVGNDAAKAFHKNICEEAHKATATGTVEMKDGKEMLTVSKIELDN
jgi:Family of unknown function (DUF6370)